MSLAPWRSPLARALEGHRSLTSARYLQLATLGADGRPANRTVVFRDFLVGTNQLQFVTDSRSEKAAQISQFPWAEACWYFPNSREQFRLAGKLTLVDENFTDTRMQQARQTLWHALSDAARLQFAWPHPGQVREQGDRFDPPPPDAMAPLPNFCLLLLQPTEVDHLELRGEPQNRWRYRCDESCQAWTVEAINP